MTGKYLLVVAMVTCAIVVAQGDEIGEVCIKNLPHRNYKDFYPDTTDCHFFYHCQYLNETNAIGKREKCPQLTFWHDNVLQCMPESANKPCQDRCLDDATHAKGCYAGTGCRQFYMCANTASYGMCCPEGTRFNEQKCACEEDTKCSDKCVQESPLIPTTVAPSLQVNATVCRDSFGTSISIVSGQRNAFYLLDENGLAKEKLFCAQTTAFNLVTCRCDLETGVTLAPSTPKRQAIFFATFDTDTNDHSPSKFALFLNGGAQLDKSAPALGSGSLRLINESYVSIPGMKSFDFQRETSFCYFFKCDNGTGCSNGAIVSNQKNGIFTVVVATKQTNILSARLGLWHPVGAVTLETPFDPKANNGWNHFCLTYDGNSARLYLNGDLVRTEFVSGFLSISHSSYLLGFDESIGYFNGHIDNVMFAPFAMTKEEIDAHRTVAFTFLDKTERKEADAFGKFAAEGSGAPPHKGAVTGSQNFFGTLTKLDHWESAGRCSMLGGKLAFVYNNQSMDRLFYFVENTDMVTYCKPADWFFSLWVGFSKNENGEWRWEDEATTLVDSSLFKIYEPSGDGDCGALWGNSDRRGLNDAPCEIGMCAVCVYN